MKSRRRNQVDLVLLELGSFGLLDVLSGDVLHAFVSKEDGEGNLHDDDPFGEGEWADVENLKNHYFFGQFEKTVQSLTLTMKGVTTKKKTYHWHWVDVKNEEVERHGKDDGSAKKRVLSWGHDEERLVLRNGVQSVEHFDCDLKKE